jgi:hypothetical protein
MFQSMRLIHLLGITSLIKREEQSKEGDQEILLLELKNDNE